MIRRASVKEIVLSAAVMLACVVCSVCIAASTAELERANEKRNRQLQLLGEIVTSPQWLPEGPIVALDGLYGRRLARVTTLFGPAVTFCDGEPKIVVAR